MLFFDKIDVFEGIDANKTSVSKECIICYNQYFLYKGFKFQLDVYNRCHDVLLMSANLDDIAILNIRGADCCCIIN